MSLSNTSTVSPHYCLLGFITLNLWDIYYIFILIYTETHKDKSVVGGGGVGGGALQWISALTRVIASLL